MLIHNAEVTGSLKINNVLFNSGSFSGSFRGDGSQLTGVTGATTASYVEYSNVGNKPALVSGSSQITYSGLSGIPSGIVSGSSQVSFTGIVDKPTLVSGSSQVTYGELSGIPAGIVSGSSQVTYSGLTGIPAGIVSSSAQITGYNIFATTSSNTFQADQVITGSLFITQNLVVAGSSSIQYISSSVVDIADNIITVNAFNPGVRFGGLAVVDSGSSPQVSGSLLFDSIKDQWIFIHETPGTVTSSVLLMGPETYNDLGNETYLSANRLPKGSGVEHLRDSNITDTGTVVSINSNTQVTGSFTVITGSAVELQVTNTGVNIGSALIDSHIISGSLRVNPNGLFVSGSGVVGIGTENPGTQLEVVSSVAINNAIKGTAGGSTGYGGLFYGNNGTTYAGLGQNGVAGIFMGGNVGIGTNDPKRGLHVVGTSAGAEVTITETAMAVGSKNFNIVGNSTNGTWSLRTLTDNSLAQSVNFVSFTASTGAATFSSSVTAGGTQYLTNTSTGTNQVYQRILNTGGDAIIGINANTGASLAAGGLAYATSIYNNTNTAIQFGTNAIFNMTILAGGNVGINTNSPTNLLHLTGNSATPSLRLGSISVGFHWDIGRENASTGDFVFNNTNPSTGTTEKMRVTQDSSAYLRMASGTGGIQFNGDTASANALDDYEEGTWTPVVTCASGVATYITQLGFYTKIGKVVTITWFIGFTKNTLSGGTVGLSNLPFSLRSGTFYPQGTVLFDNLSTVTNNITLQGDNNAASGTFIENNGSTNSHAGLDTTRLGSGTMACRGTLTYFTA
jgi:hypothetical protein